MFTQKRCPKCRGNIYLITDEYGWCEECLQCGYSRDLPIIVNVKGKPDDGTSKEVGQIIKSASTAKRNKKAK